MVGDLEFTTFSYNPDSKGDQIFAGFTAMEDYMVLKVSTFDRVPPDSIIGAWNAMVQKAQQVGDKKLMIDIIANGGGNIASGYALVQCMYPDITFADLQNPYDAPNGVQISFLQQAIAPVMQAVGSLVVDASPEVNQGLFAGAVYMNKKPAQLIEALQGTVNAMKGVFLLVNQTDPSAAGTIAAAISLTATVKREVQARKKITSGQLRGVLSSISSIYLDQYPGADPYSGTYLAGKPRITRTLDRGGVKSNYTQIFTMINPNDVESYRPKIRPGSFSSYIILGNGEGGSTSNTFETTARFYAKKYNKTVSPSVGVSFGCNGDAKDCAVTQYAGGNVAGTDMTPYYSVAGTSLMVSRIFQILPLEVLDQLSQDYEADFGSFVDDTNAFIEMLPQPPVLATSLSSFTKREIYQNTFGPGTLPLEYFQIPPDGYIQQWYTDPSLSFTPPEGASSLPQVYGAASAFFA